MVIIQASKFTCIKDICIVWLAISNLWYRVLPIGARHEKTHLKVFFWYDTDFSEFDSADIIDYIEKSVSYQKKDGRSHARPSFFWYDNDKDLKVCFFMTRVV